MAILRNHFVLAVHNVRASAEFYTNCLGFEVVLEPEGWIFVQRDNCMIMLGECPDDLPASDLGCHSYFAYLRVDDVDDYYTKVTASGLAPRLSGLATKPWGMREFSITTPDGHRITIGQEVAA